ncbi:hypothetical protein ACFJGV_14470 [Cnuibacter sp. UC19_7]|uniref:hypothetical protein n=1 Tax=Cnuibacter sp. UC19_7 TaxID=3350166 RepID=UPI00366E32CE
MTRRNRPEGSGRRAAPVAPARDLAAEAQTRASVRSTFVKHALTRLPLVGVLVITINLFVQVRGDVGLAVAVAQNLTFGGLLVVVLLNLAVFIMLGVTVAAMPLVFDRDYDIWTRVIGAAVILLLCAVLFHTASWLLLVGLAVVFVVIGVIVLLGRRRPPVPLTSDSLTAVLTPPVPPRDAVLRSLWAEGRALLRGYAPPGPERTATEDALDPLPAPRPLAEIAQQWNERVDAIREPAAKSVTRLAFAGIVGFIALFGLNIVTEPIRFAPLELVTLKGKDPQVGFILLQSGNGVFVPDPAGAAQFVFSSDVVSRELCEPVRTWYSVSPVDALWPVPANGVDCHVD